jgi:hypothetical protein
LLTTIPLVALNTVPDTEAGVVLPTVVPSIAPPVIDTLDDACVAIEPKPKLVLAVVELAKSISQCYRKATRCDFKNIASINSFRSC